MQIHEITKKSLREGVMSSIVKSIPNVASGFVQGLTGIDSPQQTTQSALDQNTRNQARKFAQQWKKHIDTQQKPQPASDAQANSGATDPNWRQDALKSAGVDFPQSESKQRSKSKTSNKNSNWRQDALKSVGAAFDPPPAPRPAPGQMPASVAASKQGKLMLQAYGKPRGGIQDIDETPQEYTTPSGIVVPGGVKTDPKSLGTVDFERWANQQLTTQVSGTGQPIDLDAVKKDPGVKAELDKVLPQIKKDPGNVAAVETYFLTAMRGMQRMAAQARQSAGVDPNATDSGENPLSTIINNQQLTAIKNLAQNSQTAAALKQALGIK
jgi:hypothetical protein